MNIIFSPNVKILILATVLMPALLLLGCWQLERAEEKQRLLSGQQKLVAMPALALSELLPRDTVRYRKVTMSGYFHNERNFLLDNRIRNGKVGYEVLTPFVDESSHKRVLVNRGWIEAPPYRTQLPVVTPVRGKHLVSGAIYIPYGKQGERGVSDSWPKVIQSVEMDLLAGELQQELASFTVRIDGSSPGALVTDWLVVTVRPEKHTAYAVQWFAMSSVLLILVICASITVHKDKN